MAVAANPQAAQTFKDLQTHYGRNLSLYDYDESPHVTPTVTDGTGLAISQNIDDFFYTSAPLDPLVQLSGRQQIVAASLGSTAFAPAYNYPCHVIGRSKLGGAIFTTARIYANPMIVDSGENSMALFVGDLTGSSVDYDESVGSIFAIRGNYNYSTLRASGSIAALSAPIGEIEMQGSGILAAIEGEFLSETVLGDVVSVDELKGSVAAWHQAWPGGSLDGSSVTVVGSGHMVSGYSSQNTSEKSIVDVSGQSMGLVGYLLRGSIDVQGPGSLAVLSMTHGTAVVDGPGTLTVFRGGRTADTGDAINTGGLLFGHASHGLTIESASAGGGAMGRARYEDIRATGGRSCFQISEGTNDVTESWNFGNGIKVHYKKITAVTNRGDPTSPAGVDKRDGSIWVEGPHDTNPGDVVLQVAGRDVSLDALALAHGL